MNDSRLDAPVVLAHRTTDLPRHAVVPLLWTLTAALAACTPAADDDGGVQASSSTDAPDTDPADSSESSESSESTTFDVDDTLGDGCWDQEGAVDYAGGAYELPFAPFGCGELPIPCETIRLDFVEQPDCETGEYSFAEQTLEARDAIEAAGRCVLTAMRDGAVATHRIEISTYEGIENINTQYTVLEGGVVTFVDYTYDMPGYGSDRYLAPRDTAWFEACLAAPDLEGLLPCLWAPLDGVPTDGAFACGEAQLSPVDESACIGETPTCP